MKTATKAPANERNRGLPKEPERPRVQEQSGKPSTEEAEDLGSAVPPVGASRTTKADIILGLLGRPEGATLDQMVEATGWLPHTTRAALTGLKKKGHQVTSLKADGERTYRVAAPAPSA